MRPPCSPLSPLQFFFGEAVQAGSGFDFSDGLIPSPSPVDDEAAGGDSLLAERAAGLLGVSPRRDGGRSRRRSRTGGSRVSR